MDMEMTPDLNKTSLLEFMKAALYSPTSPEAQLNVSLRYHKGEWLQHRTAETESLFCIRGIHLIATAAAAGNANAQNAFGEAYWHGGRGEGAYPNYEKAIEWFSKAAEQGHQDAQKSLDLAYQYKLGAPKAPLRSAQISVTPR